MAGKADTDHDRDISRIRSLADIITPSRVARAFVASLGSRKLEYRSALGSYAVARILPEHYLDIVPDAYATICSYCYWSKMPAGEEEPIENLAVERTKFGGVRHLDPEYIAFDLEQFLGLPEHEPEAEDWRRLELILRTPALLAPTSKASDLERAIKTVVRSNRYERMILLRILGFAGVFDPGGRPSFFDDYVPCKAREETHHRFDDWGYPIVWWRAEYGFRGDAVAFWFPELADALDLG
jgi:hypothetical protein